MRGVIRNVLADPERQELVYRNVAKLVRPPGVQRAEVRALTVDEARRLVEVIEGAIPSHAASSDAWDTAAGSGGCAARIVALPLGSR